MNKNLLVTAAVTATLSGCATPPAVAPLAAEDLNVGIAKTCQPSPVDLSATTAANATIEMSNDGWCAVHAKEKNGLPFQLGLLRARPQHGHVLIHKIGGETRIEYTAENRYVGADRFTVALRSSTPNNPDTTIQVAVVTTMGEGMAATPAAISPARETSPANKSRPTTRARRTS